MSDQDDEKGVRLVGRSVEPRSYACSSVAPSESIGPESDQTHEFRLDAPNCRLKLSLKESAVTLNAECIDTGSRYALSLTEQDVTRINAEYAKTPHALYRFLEQALSVAQSATHSASQHATCSVWFAADGTELHIQAQFKPAADFMAAMIVTLAAPRTSEASAERKHEMQLERLAKRFEDSLQTQAAAFETRLTALEKQNQFLKLQLGGRVFLRGDCSLHLDVQCISVRGRDLPRVGTDVFKAAFPALFTSTAEAMEKMPSGQRFQMEPVFELPEYMSFLPPWFTRTCQGFFISPQSVKQNHPLHGKTWDQTFLKSPVYPDDVACMVQTSGGKENLNEIRGHGGILDRNLTTGNDRSNEEYLKESRFTTLFHLSAQYFSVLGDAIRESPQVLHCYHTGLLPGDISSQEVELISNCKKVKYLNLNETRIDSIDFLADLKQLEVLSLRNVEGLSDLSPLRGLSNLQHLDLGGCSNVSDVAVLNTLGSLEAVYLNDTGVINLQTLTKPTLSIKL